MRMVLGTYAIHLFDGHTIWTPSQKLWALAIAGNRPIGMGSLCKVEGYDCQWISDLRVEEDWRRRGIATAIVRRLEQKVSCGQAAVGIDELNTPSQRLFESLDYVEYERSPISDVNVIWYSKNIEVAKCA